jgi:hypothetical protein
MSELPVLIARRYLILAAVSLSVLSACGGTFKTDYTDPVPPEVSRNWRVQDVVVSVPETLSVSEARSLAPQADIVWREDPPGDRRAQVGVILADAARKGASGLRGSRPVILELTVTRFHALTFEAEKRLSNAGVHNIDFMAQVVDARTGEVLAGPELVEAALPAYSGAQMAAMRQRGETQRSQISAHLAATVAGWLGAGPDVRGSFTRTGV